MKEAINMAQTMDQSTMSSMLLELPTELLQQIIATLELRDVVATAKTCRTLHTLSNDDQIWQPFVNANVHSRLVTPAPFKSFRDLYVAHQLYWFLPKHRIWFADSEPSGKLLIARYDPGTGSILGHQVVASRSRRQIQLWEKSAEVIIHSFHPRIGLDMNQSMFKLDAGDPAEGQPDSSSDRGYSGRYTEKFMPIFSEPGLYASFLLCRTLPDVAITEQTQVWPPLEFPACARTRNETRDSYNSVGHRPSRFNEVSQSSFRLRKWAEYTGRRVHPSMATSGLLRDNAAALGLSGPYFPLTRVGGGVSIRMPENITTFATLPPSCYVPTAQKPYQGIWCGDFSGHGCEFILITQPDKENERPLPRKLDWLYQWFRGGRRGSSGSDDSSSSYHSAQEEINYAEAAQAQIAHLGMLEGFIVPPGQPPAVSTTLPEGVDDEYFTDHADVPSGRLEAIKLTGDPNIPRGEYTFIAPDIGHGGFVRVADEEIFRGARIVRSAGHIAGTGFVEDQYTPSQLILISHDVLAQFWEGFGHISYFRRVDLDALTQLPLRQEQDLTE